MTDVWDYHIIPYKAVYNLNISTWQNNMAYSILNVRQCRGWVLPSKVSFACWQSFVPTAPNRTGFTKWNNRMDQNNRNYTGYDLYQQKAPDTHRSSLIILPALELLPLDWSQHYLTSWMRATQMQAKWIKLDLWNTVHVNQDTNFNWTLGGAMWGGSGTNCFVMPPNKVRILVGIGHGQNDKTMPGAEAKSVIQA